MMSHIQNAKMFVEEMGPFQCCPGLQKLVDRGIVRIDAENIDEKGYSYCVTLIGPKDVEMWIPFCPICGKKIFNVMVPVGECFNPDLPANREICPICKGKLLNSPDGPWCPKCNPNAPAKFAAEEEAAYNEAMNAEIASDKAIAEQEAAEEDAREVREEQLEREHQGGPEYDEYAPPDH